MKVWTVGFLAAGRLCRVRPPKGIAGSARSARQEGSAPQGWHCQLCLCSFPGTVNQLSAWLSLRGIKELSSDSLLTVKLEVL